MIRASANSTLRGLQSERIILAHLGVTGNVHDVDISIMLEKIGVNGTIWYPVAVVYLRSLRCHCKCHFDRYEMRNLLSAYGDVCWHKLSSSTSQTRKGPTEYNHAQVLLLFFSCYFQRGVFLTEISLSSNKRRSLDSLGCGCGFCDVCANGALAWLWLWPSFYFCTPYHIAPSKLLSGCALQNARKLRFLFIIQQVCHLHFYRVIDSFLWK